MNSDQMSRLRALVGEGNLGWLPLLLGVLALYVPLVSSLATQIWSTEEQGHGPIVLAVSIWLIWRAWPEFNNLSRSNPNPKLAWGLLIFAVLLYVAARSQRILSIQTMSAVVTVTACAIMMRGTRQTKILWFPLFFLLFLIPLPAALVDSVTQPMKLAVSSVSASVMHWFHLPVARTGVILQVGQYQLLVADACAGLHTLFSLEAMGLLYLNVVHYSSPMRNIALAILIIPISFTANVIRVIALSLITLYLGDAAGQGFLHGFAGMVLYLSALFLIISFDGLLRKFTKDNKSTASGTPPVPAGEAATKDLNEVKT